jgi:hypothetical protein
LGLAQDHHQLRQEPIACKAKIAKSKLASAQAIAERDAAIAGKNIAAALAADLSKEVQRGRANLNSFQDLTKMNRMQNIFRAANVVARRRVLDRRPTPGEFEIEPDHGVS